MELIILTLVLGSASVFIATLVSRRYFTPCFWYWAGWLAGTIGAELVTQTRLLPSITSRGHDLIVNLHIGAFWGFLIASVLFAILPRAPRLKPYIPGANENNQLPSWLWIMIVSQFALGCILLIQRVTGVGFLGLSGIRQSFLQEAYLVETLPPLYRFYSHLTVAVGIAPILLGQIHAKRQKVDLNSLALIFFASVPGGLSTGGRVWLASTFSLYAVSFLMAMDYKFARRRLFYAARTLVVPAVALLVLFGGIGFVRDILSQQDPEEATNPIAGVAAQIYMYLGISVVAVGPYSDFAMSNQLAWGQLTFPWVASQVERLGITSGTPYLGFVTEARRYVYINHATSLGTTHASIIPLMIGDFGLGHLSLVSTVLTGLYQFLFLILPKKHAWAHTIAVVVCLYGCAFAFQDARIGTASAMIPILMGLCVSTLNFMRMSIIATNRRSRVSDLLPRI